MKICKKYKIIYESNKLFKNETNKKYKLIKIERKKYFKLPKQKNTLNYAYDSFILVLIKNFHRTCVNLITFYLAS